MEGDRGTLGPEDFVEKCLDLVGPLKAGDDTRNALMELAASGGDLKFDTQDEREESAERTIRMAQLAVSSMEYQFA